MFPAHSIQRGLVQPAQLHIVGVFEHTAKRMTTSEIIKMAANGNPYAESFCAAWVRFAHTLDDAVDRDKPPSDELVSAHITGMLVEVMRNPFARDYGAALSALMVQASNAWVDSNRMDGPEKHVVKGMWHEVVFHVAFLTGGWKHLKKVTSACREYDFDVKEEQDGNV